MTLYTDVSAESQLPLQDRVALRLGRMTMRFAAAEAMTRFYLIRVLDIDDDDEPRMEAILGELSFRKLRAALVGAVRGDATWGTPEGPAYLKGITGRLARLEEQRNVLIHSAWNYSQLPTEMVREKHHVGASGTIRSDSQSFGELGVLDAIIAGMDSAAADLSTWYLTHFLGVSASHQ
jgi:hypothetical protein